MVNRVKSSRPINTNTNNMVETGTVEGNSNLVIDGEIDKEEYEYGPWMLVKYGKKKFKNYVYRKPVSQVEGRINFVPVKDSDKREEVSKIYKQIEAQKTEQQHLSWNKKDNLDVDNNKAPVVLEISKPVILNVGSCFNALLDLEEEREIVQSNNDVIIGEEVNKCNGTNAIANAAGREDIEFPIQ
ncbi:hypothetical protein KFK09_001810 [Dendrobium nobile]|uniref:Uncharacterized protein n=1 Tax=Dendrobium nobile TaxID=94219 RepID=A0A8T3C665_DENNO|nr:hypothetical protein KFK09_001810 [Dendrobium nobile]